MQTTPPNSTCLGIVDADGKTKPTWTVGIVGAGVMGRGIAAANLKAGGRVLLMDVDPDKTQLAIDQILAEGHCGSSDESMISVVTSESQFAEADMVIETVSEYVATKTEVLTRVENHISPDAILATNSSCIPIAQLASGLKHPGRFCGLHFCHPVADRLLVEIVGAKSTQKRTLERAWDYAVAIGMAPLIVGDGPGFLLNRLLMPYLNEAVELLLEGIPVESLDAAAIDFGMPFGPFEQIDEFGVDVTLAVARKLYWAFPDRIVASDLLIRMFKSGRLGRKSGRGFYSMQPENGTRQFDPEVWQMVLERQRDSVRLTAQEIRYRLLIPMYLEANRVLEEGLVRSSDDIELALKNGLGMSNNYRGLFAWADALGPAKLVEVLSTLGPLGKRFEAPQNVLSEMAVKRNRAV